MPFKDWNRPGEQPQGQSQNRSKGSSGMQNPQGNLNERDKERQQGGQGREPNLERKRNIQPTHQVD